MKAKGHVALPSHPIGIVRRRAAHRMRESVQDGVAISKATSTPRLSAAFFSARPRSQATLASKRAKRKLPPPAGAIPRELPFDVHPEPSRSLPRLRGAQPLRQVAPAGSSSNRYWRRPAFAPKFRGCSTNPLKPASPKRSSAPPSIREHRIGHVHLKVADIDRALGFYCGVLGFELIQRYGRAAFVSAGGYHHHIGLNTWESKGGPPPAPGTTGLYHVAILYPTRAALADALRRS